MSNNWKEEREKYQVWKKDVSTGQTPSRPTMKQSTPQPRYSKQNFAPQKQETKASQAVPISDIPAGCEYEQKKHGAGFVFAAVCILVILGLCGYYFSGNTSSSAGESSPAPVGTPPSIPEKNMPIPAQPLIVSTPYNLIGSYLEEETDPVAIIEDTKTGNVLYSSNDVLFSSFPAGENTRSEIISKNFQRAISFYNNLFSYTSYDGDNSLIQVKYRWMETRDKENLRDINNAACCLSAHLSTNKKPICYFIFGKEEHSLCTIAHEFTHGITNCFTFNGKECLVYSGESGALDEGFSDIFGMLIERSYHPEIVNTENRWLLGYSDSYYARNLEDPHKSKMPQPAYYQEPGYWKFSSSDNYGVHTNQSVLCKLATLLADGGTFNGYTIDGLGDLKTAKLFWYVLSSRRLTTNASYYDIPPILSDGCSEIGLSSSEQTDVQNACLAVRIVAESGNNSTQSSQNANLLSMLKADLRTGSDMPEIIYGSDGSIKTITFQQNQFWNGTVDGNFANTGNIVQNFLKRYGKVMNVSDNLGNYQIDDIDTQKKVLHQKIHNIPVFACNLQFTMNSSGNGIRSVANNLSIDSSLTGMNYTPSLSEADVQNILKEKKQESAFNAGELTIFDPKAMHLSGNPVLTWQIDSLTGTGLLKTKYFVNAHTGEVVFSYHLYTDR